MGACNTKGDREVMDILYEVFESKVPHVDAAIVGWLSSAHPELLREGLEAVTRYAREKENRS